MDYLGSCKILYGINAFISWKEMMFMHRMKASYV